MVIFAAIPDVEGRIRVAILAYPEVSASVMVYSMHDLLSAAGPAFFGRLFCHRVGMTPGQNRRRFGNLRTPSKESQYDPAD